MPISQKTIKILWAAAAGRCAFPDCQKQLCVSEAGDIAPYPIGEMAHICGDKPSANRHDANQTSDQRDDYANLILLCPTHHTVIDRKETEEKYTAEILQQMKTNHEACIQSKLEATVTSSKADAVRQIVPFLAENREAWLRFGPFSDLARKNPHNEGAHAIWVSERLSTIVPNNRHICKILKVGGEHFTYAEQQIIASFLVHARSYEQWVEDKVSYEAVVRFPPEFENMIKGDADAGQ